MRPKLKAKWIATLRSGNYQQARQTMRDKENKCCCLGVLCDITHPSEWRTFGNEYSYEIDGFSSFPSRAFRRQWGLSDMDAHLLAKMNDEGGSFDQIADWIEKNVQ